MTHVQPRICFVPLGQQQFVELVGLSYIFKTGRKGFFSSSPPLTCLTGMDPAQVAGMVSQAISRMEADVAKRKENEEKARKGEEANGKPGTEEENSEGLQPSKGWVGGLRTRKLWKSKSTSFTRAPDW